MCFLSFDHSAVTLIHNNKHFSLGQYFSGVYSIILCVWRSATVLVCQLIGVESLGGVS